MSASVEFSQLPPGSGSGKYEVNANIVPNLSAAGDCSTGTPGKYRPLRQQPLCTVASGDSVPVHQQTSGNTNKVLSIDMINPNTSSDNEQNLVFAKTVETNCTRDLPDSDSQNLMGLPLDKNSSSENEVIVNLNVSANGAHDRSEIGNVGEQLEVVIEPPEIIKEKENSMNNNSSSQQVEDGHDAENVKHKLKKKGSILQAVQFHLPKFSKKKGHISPKESSTSSDPEGSPEKKSGKKKKKDKRNIKIAVVEVEENQDDVVLSDTDAKLDESMPELEPAESSGSRDKADCEADDSKEVFASERYDDENITMVTDDVTQTCVDYFDSEVGQGSEDANEEEVEDADRRDKELLATSVDEDNKTLEDDAVVMVVVDDADVDNDEIEKPESAPADNEPSSVQDSSFASGEDFYKLPESSLSTTTDSSDVSQELPEDPSTTAEGNSSISAENSSVITQSSARSPEENMEMPCEVDDGTRCATVTEETVQVPENPTNDSNTSSFEKNENYLQDSDQHVETAVLSSSIQSSFDTDSPSVADTPEQSPKKKHKRKLPLLNVSLPSFGKKHHHRSAKSPDQSSDSDRSGSPSKKYPWRKRSPKKANSSTGDPTPKGVDVLSDEDNPQEVVDAETDLVTTEEEGKSDLTATNEDVEDRVSFPETSDQIEAFGCDERRDVPDEASIERQEDVHLEEKAFFGKEEDESEDFAGTIEEQIEGATSSINDSMDNQEDELSDGEIPSEAMMDADEYHPEDGDSIFTPEDEVIEEEDDDCLDDDDADAQGAEETSEIPLDVKAQGILQMSISLEVHASPTHISSPAEDFILTDESMDVENDVEEEAPQEDELTAAEKILQECNQIVADDSIGDVQFTPEMLSEFTKTIDAFEEEEEEERKEGVEVKKEEEEIKGEVEEKIEEEEEQSEEAEEKMEEEQRDEDERLQETNGGKKNIIGEVLIEDNQEGEVEGETSSDKLSIECAHFDVGCQLTWEDGDSENELEPGEVDGKMESSFQWSREEAPKDSDKKSVSSSASSSGCVGEDMSLKDGNFQIQGVAIDLVNATPQKDQLNVEMSAKSSEVADSLQVEEVSNQLAVSSDISPEVLVEVSPSSDSPGKPNGPESSVDPDHVIVEGVQETGIGESPKVTQEVKQKSKTKGFFSGFNFRIPKFGGRRTGKMKVSSKSDCPDVGTQGKISFKSQAEHETEDTVPEVLGLSKSSSELVINRCGSSEDGNSYVLEARAPSVPDISSKDAEFRKAKKKSFTLPNMHLHLPRFGGKKSPKSKSDTKITMPSEGETSIAIPEIQSSPDAEVNNVIKVDVAVENPITAEAAVEADLSVNTSTSKSYKSLKLVSNLTVKGDAAEVGADFNGENFQADGVYVAVPVLIENSSDEGDAYAGSIDFVNGDESPPDAAGEFQAELDAEIDVNTKVDAVDVGLPSLSNVLPEFEVKTEVDTSDTSDNCEVGVQVKTEVSELADHQIISGYPSQDFEASQGDINESKDQLDNSGEVAIEAVSGSSGSVDDTFVDKFCDITTDGDTKAVDVIISSGLSLSAGSEALENEIKGDKLSEGVEETAKLEMSEQVSEAEPLNSPTKHRFKLPSFNFSFPKFGGKHSPTKKSSSHDSKVLPSAVVDDVEVIVDGCEEDVKTVSVSTDLVMKGPEEPEFMSVECEDAVKVTIPEPVIEETLQACFVKPEVDMSEELRLKFGCLESGDKNDDVKVKLDFDTEDASQELNKGDSELSLDGCEHSDNTFVSDNDGVYFPDVSFGSTEDVAPQRYDVETNGSLPSLDEPMDLNWEDELCSRVQVTAPKFTLSDLRGGLSLGVALSEDESVHSDNEEMINQDVVDMDEKEEVQVTADVLSPEIPEMSVDHPQLNVLEDSSSLSASASAPELSLTVSAAVSERKGSTSSHSSTKSASSHSSQTNPGKLQKKKSGIMASLGLTKLHLKLSPRSKSPDRRATNEKLPEDQGNNLPIEPEAGSPKTPDEEGQKKGRWKLGKSSSKAKNKKGSRSKSKECHEEGGADACLNGRVGVDNTIQASVDLDHRPGTSSGPATSTPLKLPLSHNNSAQSPQTSFNNSLSIEQGIAIHSSPATPVSTQPPSRRPFWVVVAIDFGTTFSGYAYSFTRDPDDIQIMRKWEGGDPGVTNMKTPTTLLLTPDGEFHSFGFTARDFYHDMDHNEALRWMYFDKFKLALHNDPNLNLDTELTAANGKKIPAIKVFENALRFFREHAMEELCDQSNDGKFDPGDIRWVLTVPAIWKQPAKQFMRRAAYRAGIASSSCPEQLLIALEPEAASICIRKLRMRELVPERLSQRQKWSVDKPEKYNSQVSENIRHGTRYMVVDCGGGTVDITVHEVEEEMGTLKELHKAAGGMYGSVSVDREFEKLLVGIFTKDFIEEFKIKRPAGWVDLMIAFESRKRNANPYKHNPLNVSLPFSFIDYYKKYTREKASAEDAIWKYNSRDVTWSAQVPGMLRLSPEGMQQLFRPAVANIISLVEGLLNEPQLQGVSYLFLAGGFAQSSLLQNRMRKKFASRLRVIIPRDVGLTILKGAVMFGLDPTAVRVRRSRLTYGVGVLNKFDSTKHPKEKHVVKDSTEWCRDIFDTFVQADQSIAVGDKATRSYTPAKQDQTAIIINIYCTEKENVQFITDEGVQKCGTMHIDVSDSQSVVTAGGKRRELQLTMQFGDTEIKVSALDVPTGRCVKANFDFLSK
ncbi:uncharacterized protein LOC117294526 isoform X1 [Asterias rubens]|uniref:uncharacterized protein LOC117294526 isoform X1 n=1 Tax=Asterias rubens TaxID=7604 RepID=UPI0014552D22|nr:uncharacterized protein LOC117294526 isoform X1 [Asterias rubens]